MFDTRAYVLYLVKNERDAVSEAMLNDELANDIETDEMQSVTN